MIDVKGYDILNNNFTTFKETSKDDHDGATGSIEYLTDSDIQVINFDKVKGDYIKTLSIYGDVPKSNDALYVNGENIAFVEFKNGVLSKAEQFALGRKIYDSLLIFFDIVGLGISVTRARMDYILVYNESKNPMRNDDQYKESVSKNQISGILMKKGNSRFIRFGLERFENYCFRNVYTYSKEEFEENFIKAI